MKDRSNPRADLNCLLIQLRCQTHWPHLPHFTHCCKKPLRPHRLHWLHQHNNIVYHKDRGDHTNCTDQTDPNDADTETMRRWHCCNNHTIVMNGGTALHNNSNWSNPKNRKYLNDRRNGANWRQSLKGGYDVGHWKSLSQKCTCMALLQPYRYFFANTCIKGYSIQYATKTELGNYET